MLLTEKYRNYEKILKLMFNLQSKLFIFSFVLKYILIFNDRLNMPKAGGSYVLYCSIILVWNFHPSL